MGQYKHILFDWGDTLMVDIPGCSGPMYQWPEVQVVEGALEVLERLSQSFRCHLATNAADSTEADIRKALQRAGLDGFIERVFCQRSIGCQKPSAEYFESVLSQLECESKQVIMVGDSLEKDIRGAERVGINAIWLDHNEVTAPKGVQSVTSLPELALLLGC